MIIVDGSHLLHRNLRIPSLYNLTDSKGRKIGGIYGFLTSLRKISAKTSFVEGIFVCWDKGIPLHRRKLFSEYKPHKFPVGDDIPVYLRSSYNQDVSSGRLEISPDDKEFVSNYIFARNYLNTYLPLLGITSVMVDNCEADDIISVVCQCGDQSYTRSIYSSDGDFHQLLQGDRIIQYNDKDLEITTEKDVIKKWSLRPQTWRREWKLAKSIVGDKSDGIVGIKAIGFLMAVSYAQQIIDAFPKEETLWGQPSVETNMLLGLIKPHRGTEQGLKNLKGSNAPDIINRNYDLIDLSYVVRNRLPLYEDILIKLRTCSFIEVDHHKFIEKVCNEFDFDKKADDVAFEISQTSLSGDCKELIASIV